MKCQMLLLVKIVLVFHFALYICSRVVYPSADCISRSRLPNYLYCTSTLTRIQQKTNLSPRKSSNAYDHPLAVELDLSGSGSPILRFKSSMRLRFFFSGTVIEICTCHVYHLSAQHTNSPAGMRDHLAATRYRTLG